MLSTDKKEKKGYRSPVCRVYPLMIEQNCCSAEEEVVVNPFDEVDQDLG